MNGKSWIGHTIGGRYQINDLLGQGGMSAVYRAYDPNLRRTVAIKLIHPHLSMDPKFVGRFKEEAAAAARLRHPHIVQVHDFNVDDETYYMVMECLAGETLHARLKRLNKAQRKMALAEAVQICTQIGDALGYAHQHELVHRDIKPANIMLDENGRAVLMDFGIVKIFGGDYHTATGATVGTAMYMSPEQIRSEPIDLRADIYSLGVTLYEMISGRPPFQADSVMTLMMMVLNNPLPDLRDYRKNIPDALLDAVNKALAKEASDRFQSMQEMTGALQLAPEKLKSEPQAPTVVDEIAPQPNIQPDPGVAEKDPLPSLANVRAAAPAEIPDQVAIQEKETDENGQLAQVQPVRDPGQSSTPAAAPKPGIKARRKIPIILGFLVLLAAIAVSVIFFYGKKPAIELSSISQPRMPLSAQVAQSVVNLGNWQLDAQVEALAYSADSRLLGTANNRAALPLSPYRHYGGLWYPAEGSQDKYLSDQRQWVYDVAITPNGKQAGTASSDGTIFIWEVNSDNEPQKIEAAHGGLTSLDFSPNNLLVAAGSWDGVVGLWQLSDYNLLRTLQFNDHSIRDVAFSPDGEMLAAATDENSILIWQISDGSLIHILKGHTDVLYTTAFSPDGQLLVSGSEDYTVRLWQVNDGSLIRTMTAHTDSVYDVAFSQDGSMVASGSADGTIRLWQVSDGQMLRVLVQHPDSITAVTFSPDSYSFVSGTADGIVQFWGISEAISPDIESPSSP